MLSWMLIGVTVFGLVLVTACVNSSVDQPQGNAADTAASTNTTLPMSPEEPLPTPPIPSTPEQDNQAVSQPVPDPNLSTGGSLDPTTLITKQASTMTLTLQDMGSGWAKGTAVPSAIPQTSSFSHAYYTQGSSYAPTVQNTVAVYRSISAAESAYAREKQSYVSTSNPGIGNECLLNDSAPINKLLVFRQNNVVVWLWLKQYKEGDIERYARTVEQRIIAAAAASMEQPAPAVAPPAEQTPAEPPASAQPEGITKSMEGLITKQAYEMVLTKEDMGSGWIQGNVFPPSYRGSTSSSSVSFFTGAAYAPAVQNTVVVYRDIKVAQDAYTSARPSSATLTNPSIGNECFLNNSVPIDKLLVFRKSNVVVWLWLKQDKTGDIESYARIVEQKITF
ncbi:MAG: hypothetical protein JW901_06860 [Dehalococcoidia bacterium]|nr:hypothetical protein [Dehalococcoidia bacterium]